MSTTISMSKYDKMIIEFQQRWDGTKIDLMELVMMLDASQTVLKTALNKQPTTSQVIEMTGVIAKMK